MLDYWGNCMYKINLVDDERNLNDLLTFHLKNEGWDINNFYSGKEALLHIEDEVDLWVMDIMMPEVDGYTLIKKVKEKKPDMPVIFISARDSDIDRVVGLEFGSEDYITKPFLPRELILRVKKILNRLEKEVIVKQEKDIENGYHIDYNKRQILENGKRIELTSKEFDIIDVFTHNPSKAFSREELIEKVWGADYFGSDRVVDDLVRRIRKKLPKLEVETVYGYGYRWLDDEK